MLPPFATAFQPILDVETGRVLAQEALLRGAGGEPPGPILAAIREEDRYAADATIRARAVREAKRLGLPATGAALTLNFYPGCIGRPGLCIADTAAEAEALGFPPGMILFEVSEAEAVEEPEALAAQLRGLQRRGLRIALDDVGTGHARLPLVLAWRPDAAKIAREVLMGLDHDPAQHARTAAAVRQLTAFGIPVMVEGVETAAECRALHALGVRAMQGFLFARPATGALPVPVLPGNLEL